jgi:hypothetical protein
MIGDAYLPQKVSFFDLESHLMPPSFSSIMEAKYVFNYGYGLFRSSDDDQLLCDPEGAHAALDARIDHLETLLSSFSLALQALIESTGSSFTPKDDIAVAVLQLHVLNALVSSHVKQQPLNDPSFWNKFLPQFKEMILLGEKIVSTALPENSHGGQTPLFCFDLGIVIPVYNVASLCQDPIIRRKAIVLLRSTPRQEGLWNSLLVANAAERIIEIEESELGVMEDCTDSPDRARSISAKPVLKVDERGGRLQYIKQGQGDNAPVNVVEEIFSWVHDNP